MIRRRTVVIVGVVAVALAATAAVVLAWLPHYRPALHAGERLGVDVSHHQGTIDWAAAHGDGMTFAYIKATEGADFTDASFTDASFAANWAGAAAAGLARGAYHFFTFCSAGADQARHFLAVAPPDPASLAPAVDLELAGNCGKRPPAADVTRELGDFLGTLEQQSGRPTLLYVGRDFAGAYPAAVPGDHPRWAPDFLRHPGGPWAVWQVMGKAHVAGISGSVDLDVAR